MSTSPSSTERPSTPDSQTEEVDQQLNQQIRNTPVTFVPPPSNMSTNPQPIVASPSMTLSMDQFQELMTAMKQQVVVTAPPIPGSDANPFFTGEGVTEFFERFEAICNNHGVPLVGNDDTLVRKVIENVSTLVRGRCKRLPGYRAGNYDELKSQMHKEFRKEDVVYEIGNRRYMEFLANQERTERDDLAEYIREHIRSLDAMPAEHLDDSTKAMLLLRGLPKATAARLWRTCGVTDKTLGSNYEQLLEKAQQWVNSDEDMQSVVYNEPKADVRQLYNSIKKQTPKLNTDFKPKGGVSGEEMDSLADKMQQMLIATIRKLESDTAKPLRPSMTQQYATENASADPRVNIGTLNNLGMDDGMLIEAFAIVTPEIKGCWMCGLEGHTVPTCPTLKEIEDKGLMHRCPKTGHMFYGKVGPNAEKMRYVWKDRKVPKLHLLCKLLEQRYGNLDFQNTTGLSTLMAKWARDARKSEEGQQKNTPLVDHTPSTYQPPVAAAAVDIAAYSVT